MKLPLCFGLVLSFLAASLEAQIQTLVVTPGTTNSGVLNVPANGYAMVKSADYTDGGALLINVGGASFNLRFPDENVDNLVIAGPATIQLQALCCVYLPTFATIEVQPTPFPPDKTLTVGAYSGNVQVTMQVSTNLVDWTTAINGMVYTNSPGARFFRIQMVTNAQSP